MSLIPSFFSRAPTLGGGWNNWAMDPLRSLELFDPFDELDRELSRQFHWFLKPDFMGERSLFPRVPQKYRITVDCSGFSPNSIKTEWVDKENKLVVSAHEEQKIEGTDDFSTKRFKKTYKVPDNVIPDKMVSFMAANGELVIEFPLKETETQRVSDLFPQIVDREGGAGKQVQMRFSLPEHIDPSKVNVSVKGHDVILRAEDTKKSADGVSRFHYFQRTTLPENTNLNDLRCFHDKNQVTVSAPLALEQQTTYRKVPIESWQSQQQQKLPTSQQQQQQPQIQQGQSKQQGQQQASR